MQPRPEPRDERAVSPGRLLLAATLACLVASAVAVAARLQQPGLGLVLESDVAAGTVRIASAAGPGRLVPTPSILVAITGRSGEALPVAPSDVIEEPDFFVHYQEMTSFFARQTAFSEVLHEREITVTVRRGEEPAASYRVAPALPSWHALPGAFWFQLLAGSIAFVVSVWVLVLRPRDLAVRLFAVMGVAIPGFAVPAAIYASRELAMAGESIRVLSALNHLGANLFGCGLVAFFLVFPRRLCATRWLWLVPLVFGAWFVVDVARLAPDQNWGSRLPILLEMLIAITSGVLQWRATRGDPRGRALLRWLGASVLVGSGLFVFSIVGSSVAGWFPPIPQGYSFGFFLLMHVSFALGLRRHRLFDLDEWAYRVLFWVLAGLGVVALDAVLVAVFDASRALSTWGVLLLSGFVYVPLRSWLWTKAVARKTPAEHEIFESVLRVAFAQDVADRARLWRALLVDVFDPLTIAPIAEAPARASVREDGIRLDMPEVAGAPGYRLEYPWRGRGLYATRHERLAEQLVGLLRHAETQHEAFERGVRNERTRIARDMHDDIGAGLLSSLYRDDLESTRDAIRQAIGDVRSTVHELTFRRLSLADALGELRHETVRRLRDAKITVDWPLPDIAPDLPIGHSVYRHVGSMLRELTSNVVRHAGARGVRVQVEVVGDRLRIDYCDDGAGCDPATMRRGSGLDNLERRASGIGGTFAFDRVVRETRGRIDVPVVAATSTTTTELPAR